MKKLILLSLLSFVAAGCATAPVVERVDVREQVDLSGGWNDYDAQLVAQRMILDCLDHPWREEFLIQRDGQRPVVIVGNIRNNSHEHINSEVFTKTIERELINSGKVRFVASPTERIGVRDERDDMQRGYTSNETIKKHGMEVGADFMLIGTVNSVKDQIRHRHVILFQVNLELINIATNEKVWIGQKEIKKVVEHNSYTL